MTVLIEFTQDTEKRKAGDKLWVDERSAKSFAEKGVAVRVADAPDDVVEMKPNQPATTDIVRE
jgi:hypothetical protein